MGGGGGTDERGREVEEREGERQKKRNKERWDEGAEKERE